MKRLLFIMFCAMFSLAGMAQNLRTVKGAVMNENDEPLSGVIIKAVNSDSETITDKNGRFELKVDLYIKFVEASYENYITAKAEIDGSYIVFNLKLDKQLVKEKAKRAAEQAKAEAEAKCAAEKAATEKAKAEAEAKRAAERLVLKAERKAKYSEHISGFNSMVDVTLFCSYDWNDWCAGINYIAGCRFNNYLFVGAGAGVEMPLEGKYILEPTYFSSGIKTGVTIPLFAHVRANFLNRRWSPFFAFSAGARFMIPKTLRLELSGSLQECKCKYNFISPFVNPQLGVNFRATPKTSVYLSVGANGYVEEMLSYINRYQIRCKPRYLFGYDLHLGVTF